MQTQENTSSQQPGGHDEDGESPNVLLVTANVGSLFEDPVRLLQQWLKEFLRKVSDLRPQFLALHLQEVGGKTYEKSMECVQEFIRSLCEASEMKDFEFIRIFMDEDFNSAEHFTALGNVYFGHKSLKSLRIWNFLTHDWESAEGKNIYSGNIETIATKEKSKFPQHFFPECKWSRKGFMRTRWEVNTTVIDLVNIHLFHDASNFAACEVFPSVYCKTRRRALVHTLERFHLDEKNGLVPYFLFGDFNFRCDTEGVIKELTENLTAHRVQSIKNDSTKVHYRNSVGDNVLTVGKKEFNHADHQLKFKEVWLKKYDRELQVLNEILVEYPIEFPPTYPYEEDPEMPTDYMSTRCPSWCDRILMSPQAREIILDESASNPYNIIGENICMGDHKPIYLNIRLKPNQGTYKCCKCYLNNANNNSNKSTSLDYTPAVTYCPYNIEIYCEILQECKKLNKDNVKMGSMAPLSLNGTEISNLELPQHFLSSPIDEQFHVHEIKKNPPVSIKLINSDNLHVCMCSEISNLNVNVDMSDVDSENICPECQNIIKQQPVEHRYRLISKRLMLPNNIIVNRIDTQYLSTYSDISQQRQDPYTPESVESHSPCPELNTQPTTTNTTSSSNRSCSHSRSHSRSRSRSPYGRVAASTETLDQSVNAIKPFTEQLNDEVDGKETAAAKIKDHHIHQQKIQQQQEQHQHHHQQQQLQLQLQRGVVTPKQLKSRLEDLQRSSLHSLSQQKSGDTAGDSDVENVEFEICPTTRAPVKAHKKHNNRCLPNCCNIH